MLLSLGKIMRHVQLKASMHSGKTQRQPVHGTLGEHPSGCVVWIVLNEDRTFNCFQWYGGDPGEPLTGLTALKRAKQARANAQGVKDEREHTWTVPKSKIEKLPDMAGLVQKLFGQTAVGSA